MRNHRNCLFACIDWNSVTPVTIGNCFLKACFSLPTDPEQMILAIGLGNLLWMQNDLQSLMSPASYLFVLPTCKAEQGSKTFMRVAKIRQR
ncbi:hypothetical protein Y1Q_0022094 [Alligator mississippiensis]|uniref:Uncharacterized protein n=1 Tax=Alligator mississippiensis TaxID=8496 RepID=A0A151M4P0_ALLMI|nr:hypothetical protein Y1Q_0022094 [Alligator mississippiensis]